jgi:hypothetical protein
MWRRSPAVSTVLATIALVLLPAVSNIQANVLPASWTPYLWVTWPTGLLLAAPLIYLDVRQRHREALITGQDDGTSTAQRRRLQYAADSLAAAVRQQWADEKRLRSLDHPVPLRLRWASSTRPVAAALADVVTANTVPTRPRAVRGDGTAPLATLLNRVRDRQLVILGAPGAGKSALALLFVLHQLEQRNPDDPVAVLLTASSWDPRTEQLHTWLARRIAEEYPALSDTTRYGVDVPRALVAEGRVMAVLDGLDEMPASLRPIAIAALDQAAAPDLPLVVTCRSEEYEAAVTGGNAFLSRAAVVEIQPLDLAAVDRFLAATRPAADKRWQLVMRELHAHPDLPLAQVLTSPLMVTLARAVYGSPAIDPHELLEITEVDEIEHHLLDAIVPAAYQDAPTNLASPTVLPGSNHQPQRARVWLTFLARHANRCDTGDLAWWQLAEAIPRTILALITALPVGLLFGVSGGLAGGPLVALVLAVVFGAATALSSVFARPPAPARVQLRFRSTARPFLSTFVGGCAAGLGVALGLRLSILPAAGSGLVVGLAFASRVWLSVPTDAREAPTPELAMKENRTDALNLALVMAVSLGFFDGLGFTVSQGLPPGVAGSSGLLIAIVCGASVGGFAGHVGYGRAGGVAFGLASAIAIGVIFAPVRHPSAHEGTIGPAYGLAVGLAVGTAGALSRAWGRFTVARVWLALRGHLPWQLMDFLNDAHRRGVLRQSGAVHEFRHLKLRDHLARTDSD